MSSATFTERRRSLRRMSARVAVVLVVLGSVSCRPDAACPPRKGFTQLTSRTPSPIGQQSEVASIQAEGGALELVYRVLGDDGGTVLEFNDSAPRKDTTFEFDLPRPGYYVIEAVVTCDGNLIEGARTMHPVYEPLVFTHSIPRVCERLTRLSSTLLECDGVVLTLEGAVAAGFLQGAQTRPVVFDGGFVRWLRDGNQLVMEADGVALSTTVDAGVSWVAARDFSVLGADTLVILTDAGLEVMPFDAGPQRVGEVCAAVSEARGRAVLQCAGPGTTWPLDFRADGLAACPLVHDGTVAGVGTCGHLPGTFLRQETSGRVLTLLGPTLSWFDLLETFTTSARVERGSRFGGVELDQMQYGQSPVFFPDSEAHVLRTGESSGAWLYVSRGTHASAQLAWRRDGGITAWADLP